MRQYCNFNQAQALVNYGLNEKKYFLSILGMEVANLADSKSNN